MPPLSDVAVKVLKATAPVVKSEGTKITTRMYEIMFSKYPVVKNLFNASHFVKAGETKTVAPQAQALANAVFAYAANADNLSALNGAIAMMAHKHVSFNVEPEHYAIVGECLLAAMKDVLGDAANDEVMDGWKEAYGFLADLLIGIEENMKKENSLKRGGWSGFTPLVVANKVVETEDVTSFHLQKPDGSELPDFRPGQYLSFRIPKGEIESYDHDVVRNYSISNKPGEDFLRVSIKREKSSDGSPDGAASNYFHERLSIGSQIEVGMPCGTFVLKEDNERPIVLIAAGIGLTPMVSMLDYVLSHENDKRTVTFIECAKSEARNPMRSYIDSLTDGSRLVSHAFYTGGVPAEAFSNTMVQYGRIAKESLMDCVPSPADGNEYYFCGPSGFLKHVTNILNDLQVPSGQVNYEYFGPTQH